MGFESYSDEELIQRLRGGETEIMDYILEKYKPLVRKNTNALFLIGGEPEDLIQEGMIGLFKAVRDYSEDKDASFYTFAQLCISRQLYSAMEASNRKKHMPLNTYVSFSQDEKESGVDLEEVLEGQVESPEQLVIQQEVWKEFQEELEKDLSKMEHLVLQYYLEGNNYLQIAHILNKSPKSVDNALQRIRQKVKQLKYS